MEQNYLNTPQFKNNTKNGNIELMCGRNKMGEIFLLQTPLGNCHFLVSIFESLELALSLEKAKEKLAINFFLSEISDTCL